MAFANVGGFGSYQPTPQGAGGYKHGDRLPDGSNYIDPNAAVGYDQSKGWGGVTGEINSGVYTGAQNAPSMYGNPDTSWIGGNGTGTQWNKGGDAALQGSGTTPSLYGGAPAAPMGAQGYGGGYSPQYGTGSRNPYQSGAAGAIVNRLTDNLQRRVLPGVGIGAMQAGGYGGSRQGVIEANAMRDMNTSAADALAGMYSQDWNSDQNRQVQRYGMDQNFWTAERSGDRADKALGAQMYTQGMNGEFDPIKNASSVYSPYTGLGATTTNSQQSGGGATGAVGGALAAYQLWLNSQRGG